MDPERLLDALRHESARVAATDPSRLTATVPTMPDWTVERVIRHLGKVQQWTTAVVQLPAGAALEDVDASALAGIPKGPACIDAFASTATALVAAFEARSHDDPIATFVGPDHVRWWLRRQAHEITIHRTDIDDAIAAAGGPAPTPIDPDVAADGIDEWASVFVAQRFAHRSGAFPDDLEGASIHLHGTDDPTPADGAEWIIRIVDGTAQVETVHAKGDVALRGPAASLLLTLWNRRSLDTVDIVGDRSVIERFLTVATF